MGELPVVMQPLPRDIEVAGDFAPMTNELVMGEVAIDEAGYVKGQAVVGMLPVVDEIPAEKKKGRNR